MLKWMRLRKPVDAVCRIAGRPLRFFDIARPGALPLLWRQTYCCTSMYYWSAIIAEDVCPDALGDQDKLFVLREAFARMVEETGGVVTGAMGRVLPDGNQLRRRALGDLKRVADLYRGIVDDRYMIYPEYREAVYEDGRSAPAGNKWRLKRQASYEILLVSYLSGHVPDSAEGDVP